MTYTLTEAARLVGVLQPTATLWLKAGLLHPEGYVGRQGVEVRFSDKEFEELKTLAVLRRAGLTFHALHP
jgi:DNA-binding transcriptional MerR regulator